MNKVRFYNAKTDQVRFMPADCERALKGIGFVKQELPPVEETELTLTEAEPKKPTTKPKKNAVNN